MDQSDNGIELEITPTQLKEIQKNGQTYFTYIKDEDELDTPYFKIREWGNVRVLLARLPPNNLPIILTVTEDVFVPEGRTKLKVLVNNMKANNIPSPPGYTADLVKVLDEDWL